MPKVKLSECGQYVLSPKISTNILTIKNYITTDNMLPNKAGITLAENVPLNTNVTAFKENDILLSNIRPYFKKIWLAEFNGGCSADILIFRANEKFDAKYIKYCLSQDSFFNYDMAGSKGSKMPRGDKNHILNFELNNFNLSKQKQISKLLYNVDKKIELNNKINTELENIAKTLYDYWFVQFDFPDENERPYKSSGGKMVYNEILKREIPERWEVKSLLKNSFSDLIQLGIETFKNNKIYLPTANIQNDEITDFSNLITYDNRESRANMQPVKNSVWFAKMKNSKKVLYFGDYSDYYIDNIILSTGMCGIKCSDKYLEYLWNTINSDYFEIRKDILAHGATQEAVNNDDLKSLYIIEPLANIIEKYHNKTKDIYHRRYLNSIENQKLIFLRNWLLPMLMNGQITVRD